MIYNKFSRRYFLTGAGAGLMIPFLPSIMKHAYAATPPKRYIQMLSTYGVYGNYFFPSEAGMTTVATGITARSLSSSAGDISSILAPLNSLRTKISVVRGLHLPGSTFKWNTANESGAEGFNHNGCAPTTCSTTGHVDNVHRGPPRYPYSIDSILAQSSKIYPVAGVMQKQVVCCPGGGNNYNTYTWNQPTGSAERIQTSPSITTNELLTKFTQLGSAAGGGGGGGAVDPAKARKLNVMNSVFSDYKSISSSSKISGEDKRRFDAYMQIMSEIQGSLVAVPVPTAASCDKPAQDAENSLKAKFNNQAKIIVAAMACDLTRVASITNPDPVQPSEDWHDSSHDPGLASKHSAWMRGDAENMAYVMNLLNGITEAGSAGTMLDNTLMYWNNEFGENRTNENNPHIMQNFPVVIGGGGGNFRLGEYINMGGRPLNNLAVSIFNAMGLSSADYERTITVPDASGKNVTSKPAGFGEYHPPMVTLYKLSAYTSDAEKRKPLPYLYIGDVKG
jgi:hypothetical protein